jgi:uncharacterized protein (TIGR00369 family)
MPMAKWADSKRLAADIEERVRKSFERQGFMQYLGAEMVELRSGHCQIRVPYREELSQQHGYFHAGVTGAIADSASGFAAFTLLLQQQPDDTTVLTVEYKLNLLTPAVGDSLVARAEVIRSGKTLTICRADVVGVKNGRETLCAASLSTIMAVSARPERPRAQS